MEREQESNIPKRHVNPERDDYHGEQPRESLYFDQTRRTPLQRSSDSLAAGSQKGSGERSSDSSYDRTQKPPYPFGVDKDEASRSTSEDSSGKRDHEARKKRDRDGIEVSKSMDEARRIGREAARKKASKKKGKQSSSGDSLDDSKRKGKGGGLLTKEEEKREKERKKKEKAARKGKESSSVDSSDDSKKKGKGGAPLTKEEEKREKERRKREKAARKGKESSSVDSSDDSKKKGKGRAPLTKEEKKREKERKKKEKAARKKGKESSSGDSSDDSKKKGKRGAPFTKEEKKRERERRKKEKEANKKAKEANLRKERELRRKEWNKKPAPFNEAFDETGRGGFSYKVLVASCLIYNYTLIEMFAVAYVITPAECDLNLTVTQKSLVFSAAFIGISASTFLWGRLTDTFGRRLVMLPCLAAAIAVSIVSSFMDSFWPFYLLRCLNGLLIGAPASDIFVYLGELQTRHFRDTAIAIMIASGQAIFVIIPAVAWLVVYNSWSFNLGSLVIRPWRVFMWTWPLFGVAGGVLLYLLPETPKFVMIRRSRKEALRIMETIYAKNVVSDGDFPAKSLSDPHEHTSNLVQDFLQLVQRPVVTCFVLLNFCMFVTYVLSHGLYIWIPDIINEMLKHFSESYSICNLINYNVLVSPEAGFKAAIVALTVNEPWGEEEMKSDDCKEGEVNPYLYPSGIVIETINLIPFVLVVFFIHRMNKVLVYAIILLINSLALVLCSVIPQSMAATVFYIIALASGACMSILSALSVEAFPTSIRALAVSIIYTSGYIGAIVGTHIISALTESFCIPVLVIIAVISLASAAVLYRFWPKLEDVISEMEARNYSY